MTEQTAYTPRPQATLEDVDAVVHFIGDRIRPLRDAAPHTGEEFQAFSALLDMTVYMHGAAQALAERGESVQMLYFYLTRAAQRWDKHPDFLPAWDPDR